jgi:hypothetical protein
MLLVDSMLKVKHPYGCLLRFLVMAIIGRMIVIIGITREPNSGIITPVGHANDVTFFMAKSPL